MAIAAHGLMMNLPVLQIQHVLLIVQQVMLLYKLYRIFIFIIYNILTEIESNGCYKKVIDAREAKSLTVYCGYGTSYSCEYALIHCPDNGGDCDIQCTKSSSCYYTHIYGFTSDNINLNCTYQGHSCGNVYLFANYSNNVNINCESSGTKSSYYTSCGSMRIYGDNIKNKLTYQGIGDYSGSSMYFYLRQANNVELKFKGVNSGYNTYVHTDYAKKTSITCHANDEDLTCNGMYIYYKSSSNILNLICQGYGCKDLNVEASDSTSPSWNNFNVDMKGCGVCSSISSCITSWYISCDDSYNYYYYSDSSRFYGTSSCSNTECNCNSIYKSVEYSNEGMCNLLDADYTCNEQNCTIDCSKVDCSGKTIDGSNTTSLTVLCDKKNSNNNNPCNHANVYCPIKDGTECNIVCSLKYGCEYADIYAIGNTNLYVNNDYMSGYYMEIHLSGETKAIINCTKPYSCEDMTIHGDTSKSIDLICYGDDTSQSSSCYSMTINAKNVTDYVSVLCDGDYACYSLILYANYANYTNFDGNGEYSIRSSTIHADNSSYLEVNCRTIGEHGCYGLTIYGPQKESNTYKSNLRCEGHGCTTINWHSTNGLSDMSTNIYGCSECKSIGDCINSWNVYCTHDYTYYYEYAKFNGTTCQDYHDYYYYNSGTCNTKCNNEIDRISGSYSKALSQKYCGLFTPEIVCDNDDDDCEVNCKKGTSKCSDVSISAENSNNFTLICNDISSCKNSKVYCPYNYNSQCNIICDHTGSCDNLEINAFKNGYNSLNIDCLSSKSCNNIKIYGFDIHMVTLNCLNTLSCKDVELSVEYVDNVNVNCIYDGGSQVQPICESVYVRATNATSVINIDCIGKYTCDTMFVDASDATSATLTVNAFGHKALVQSILHFEDTNKVNINCNKDTNSASSDIGCYESQFFTNYASTSHTHKPTIYCNGYGCEYINLYSNRGIIDFDFELNTCGSCDYIDKCVSTWNIKCIDIEVIGNNVDITDLDKYSLKTTFYGNVCDNPNTCECGIGRLVIEDEFTKSKVNCTPTATPTNIPSISPLPTPPTITPTETPIKNPTKQTQSPTNIPSTLPSSTPTALPTNIPTALPTANPSISTTNMPSISPTIKTTAEAIKESKLNKSASKFIVGIIIFSIFCVIMAFIFFYGYKRLAKKQLNEIEKIMKENMKSDPQNNDNNNCDNNVVTSGIEGNETSAMFNPNFVINEALVENNASINDNNNANNDVNNVNDVNIAGNEYVQLNQDN